MKIQLDYDKKTVSIEDNVNLGDFVDKIRKIVPDWREWKLETKTEIVWNNPVPYTPAYPWWEVRPYDWPTITVDGTGSSYYADNNFNAHSAINKVQLEVE